jgi:uncharacterized protein YjbI with pentapeptide repeats
MIEEGSPDPERATAFDTGRSAMNGTSDIAGGSGPGSPAGTPTRTGRGERLWRVTRTWVPRILRIVVAVSLVTMAVGVIMGVSLLAKQGDLRPLAPWVPHVAAGGALVILLLVLWLVPRLQVRLAAAQAGAGEIAALEDRYRNTLLRVMVAGMIAVALYLAGREVAAIHDREATAQFAGAAEQLASAQMVVRVAGIYGLEAAARLSERFRAPVGETLQAFLRQRIADQSSHASPVAAADVEAVTRVLAGRITDGNGPRPFTLDLRSANLRHASLPGAQLDRSNLSGAYLEQADLTGAHIAGIGGSVLRGVHLDSAVLVKVHLDGADLTGGAALAYANLTDADLDGADLDGADLRGAHLVRASLAGADLRNARLEGASLAGADLQGATLAGARLTGADFADARLRNTRLAGTDLSGVLHLTREQLAGARLDSTTILPPGLAGRAGPG